MSDNGQQYDQDDNFEQRLYQTLALIERAGEQQRSAAATVERLEGLEQRINQVIQSAATEASARIASEARSALDGAFTESAAALSQAARSAVTAAENLRWPWWLYLLAILLTGFIGGAFGFWATHRVDSAYYEQDQLNQQLIREGRMLERIWPRLTAAERKKLERLDVE
jgi:hypothetical protein